MNSDDDTSHDDQHMPLAPMHNSIFKWLRNSDVEDVEQPFGRDILDESNDGLVKCLKNSRGILY